MIILIPIIFFYQLDDCLGAANCHPSGKIFYHVQKLCGMQLDDTSKGRQGWTLTQKKCLSEDG
jgi:hypothetical protein